MELEKIIQELIVYGEKEKYGDVLTYINRFPRNQLEVLLSHQTRCWDQISEQYSNNDMYCLLKSLIIIEAVLYEFGTGSTSLAIGVYSSFRDRSKDHYPFLEEWILEQTTNDFVGRIMRLGTDSPSVQKYQKKLTDRYKESGLVGSVDMSRCYEDIERQKTDKKRKIEKNTYSLFGAIQRKDLSAIKSLRRKGARVDKVGSDGKTALEMAKLTNNKHIIDSIICDLNDEEINQRSTGLP